MLFSYVSIPQRSCKGVVSQDGHISCDLLARAGEALSSAHLRPYAEMGTILGFSADVDNC